jgi:hypothetical protein
MSGEISCFVGEGEVKECRIASMCLTRWHA